MHDAVVDPVLGEGVVALSPGVPNRATVVSPAFSQIRTCENPSATSTYRPRCPCTASTAFDANGASPFGSRSAQRRLAIVSAPCPGVGGTRAEGSRFQRGRFRAMVGDPSMTMQTSSRRSLGVGDHNIERTGSRRGPRCRRLALLVTGTVCPAFSSAQCRGSHGYSDCGLPVQPSHPRVSGRGIRGATSTPLTSSP